MRAGEAAKSAGITYRQLDYWMRSGAIYTTAPDAMGSGSRREFNDQEVADLAVLGRIVKRAKAEGFEVASTSVINRIWDALATGRDWQLVLSVHGGETDA